MCQTEKEQLVRKKHRKPKNGSSQILPNLCREGELTQQFCIRGEDIAMASNAATDRLLPVCLHFSVSNFLK
ncbi:MAG: hypothetical protein FWG34_12490 [Oscillospiraceae bacterium]|nr:hypothetical protein [Oscillospiraceae bacterium]